MACMKQIETSGSELIKESQFRRCVRYFAREIASPDVVSFPFAYTVTVMSGIGLSLLGWGFILSAAWLATAGAVFVLLAGGLDGFSLGNN